MTTSSDCGFQDWSLFTGGFISALDLDAVRDVVGGKRILVTGAGGFIGSAIARRLAALDPHELILLDIGEFGLYQLERDLGAAGRGPATRSVVGSILDNALMEEIFTRRKPQIVFHAAACKHVPLMEANPFSAAATNAIGTQRLLRLATSTGTERCVLLSTDKAVDPGSIMGATKRVSELSLLTQGGDTRLKALRLGNVLGSSGSVGPLFLTQISRGGPVTVTHPDATRYFLTVDQAVEHLLSSLLADGGPAVLVPGLGQPHRIADLAKFLITRRASNAPDIEIVFTGLRHGDKLAERMISPAESLNPVAWNGLHVVQTPVISITDLARCLQYIEDAVRTRDLGHLIRAIQQAVPEYRPSDLIQSALSDAAEVNSR